MAICTVTSFLVVLSGWRSEPPAVSRGGYPERAHECAAHRLRCPVTAVAGDLLDAVAGVLQQPPRGFQPDFADVLAGRHAGLGGEGTGELAGRQAGPGGEGADRQIRGRPLGNPLLDLAQRLPLRDLGPQLRAELCLVARTPQEHHEMPG